MTVEPRSSHGPTSPGWPRPCCRPEAHAGRTYDLTGPEALTLDEVATVLTAGLRRSVSYVDETVPQAYESRAHYGAPDWQVDAWVSTYTAIANGELATVTEDIPLLSTVTRRLHSPRCSAAAARPTERATRLVAYAGRV